jgi:hypothetical protein
MQMTSRSFLAALLAIAATGGVALAQRPGPNGGLVGGSGDHQVELVASPTELAVYLLDDGKPSPVQGSTIRAVVQDGGRTINVALAVSAPTRLTGRLEAPLAKGARVVISGRDGHGHSVSARFVIP